jgi:hypothetical protein
MTRLCYRDSATADHLELIALYNDDRIGIDPDAKQLAMPSTTGAKSCSRVDYSTGIVQSAMTLSFPTCTVPATIRSNHFRRTLTSPAPLPGIRSIPQR